MAAALNAALLFGAGNPLTKLLFDSVGPWLLRTAFAEPAAPAAHPMVDNTGNVLSSHSANTESWPVIMASPMAIMTTPAAT